MAVWHWIAGGGAAALASGALLATRSAPKGGSLLSSEQARAQQLIPAAQRALVALQSDLAGRGIRTYVGSTKRTEAQQAGNVAKGVSATQQSWHLLGRGVDLYPIGPDGKPDLKGAHVELFRAMHAAAPAHGWRGLAFNADGSKRYITTVKGKVWDGGHLEFPEGMTFAQALARDGGGKLA